MEGNLAAAGSGQGLMQSRSGEYVNQDMQRQKMAQETNQESLKPIDDFLKRKEDRQKAEEQEISKFIDFKNPVMPKDEQERVQEAASIVKMIKDKADRKDIETAKINFIANDERRKAEYKRAVYDLKLANSKPDEYEIVANPFAATTKSDYKSKFGSDRYSTEHFIKPNQNIDVQAWIEKKTPEFSKQTPQGLNKSITEEGTSFADEDTRMKWQASTINQMLDGVTPQSRTLLKQTTEEVLKTDPELEYYPEELDHVVKQVAATKILKTWDAKNQKTKIDNNAPNPAKDNGGFTINVGGGGENKLWKFGKPKEVNLREGGTQTKVLDKKTYEDKIIRKGGTVSGYDYYSMQTKAVADNPPITVGDKSGMHFQGVYKKKGSDDIGYFKFTTAADGSGEEMLVPMSELKGSTYSDIRTNVGEDDFEKAAAIGKYAPKKAEAKAAAKEVKAKKIVKTGTTKDGKKVVKYDDGTIEIK